MPYLNNNDYQNRFGDENGEYRIQFYSAAEFSGRSGSEGQLIGENKELNRELQEEGYNLIHQNAVFNIDTVDSQSLLSGEIPTLHLALTVAKKKYWEDHYIVLIFDENGNQLIDWAIPSFPINIPDAFLPLRDPRTLYFQIPLVTTRADRVNPEPTWERGDNLKFGLYKFSFLPNSPLEKLFFIRNLMPFDEKFYQDLSDEFIDAFHSYIKTIDKSLKHATQGHEQFQSIDQNGNISEYTNSVLAVEGKVLLLCHGIFSSTNGAFDKLLKSNQWNTLYQSHNGQVFAWDHYTVSKDTEQNADELLNYLKLLKCNDKIELNIICHSRGAGVIRNLLENPKNIEALKNNKISVNNVVFVAGACLGSQLAAPTNVNLFFRILNMINKYLGGDAIGIGAILKILKLLVTLMHHFPGVYSMNPQGTIIKILNGYQFSAADNYKYIRANFSSATLPKKLACEIERWGIFHGADNDLVVPYEGAGSSSKYQQQIKKFDILNLGSKGNSQSVVHHTNFFENDKVIKAILKHL